MRKGVELAWPREGSSSSIAFPISVGGEAPALAGGELGSEVEV